MEHDENSSLFSAGNSAQERGISYVPQSYVLADTERPSLVPKEAYIPIIDMAALRNIGSEERSRVLQEIKEASSRWGFFQVSLFVELECLL
ncbi:putative non-hem dioxygenase domain, isopenicillin N synthase [Lupinus albus]|uniref:Putative non-hem dioxygenase domain, isopenicillin N synthase n=1 Tax=Lupinus albus TaxID=3870 RepID=A0A6A4R596_LUPAL|nr:putative non-hem dioxygenase domain, isopenicillin N synthase [Lupinus albus]KAE9621161.1 putative non-hem dioxygenase domain, isopenicillin N synthase [Lupinus albus]